MRSVWDLDPDFWKELRLRIVGPDFVREIEWIEALKVVSAKTGAEMAFSPYDCEGIYADLRDNPRCWISNMYIKPCFCRTDCQVGDLVIEI